MKFVFRSIAYFKSDCLLIALLFILIGASVILNLLHAWPMAILVDTVLSQSPHSNAFHTLFLAPFGTDKLSQILGIAAVSFFIKVLQDAVSLSRSMLNNRIHYNGTRKVREDLYIRLQELSISWHKSRSQGDTIYRLNYDCNGPWGILDTLIGSAAASITLTAMVVIMLSRSTPLTLVAMAVTPLLMVANRHFGRTIRENAERAKQADACFTVACQRLLSAIGLIQAFGREDKEAKRFGSAAQDSVQGAMQLAWQENLYPLCVQIVFGLGASIIFGYGGYLVYRDQFLHPLPQGGGVTCGDLIVFMAYLNQLWDPLGWVLGFRTKIQTNAASCQRVFEVLDEGPAVADMPDAKPLPLKPRVLNLAKLRFSYDGKHEVLKDITACVTPGEMVAFIGPSGTGKSSLLNLLPRFYDPTSGSVCLDGKDIRGFRIADVRRHMAVVSQDCVLFPDSIAANLCYGCPAATKGEVEAAARLAGASEFIEALPHGYETLVIEGGQNLSGGQRQRLAIARALLSKAPILILDEPTSALDLAHEQWILETLQNIRGGRTIILVTHRVESVADCDQILLMEEGTIIERGTHFQLLARRGRYARAVGSAARERRDDRPLKASAA